MKLWIFLQEYNWVLMNTMYQYLICCEYFLFEDLPYYILWVILAAVLWDGIIVHWKLFLNNMK